MPNQISAWDALRIRLFALYLFAKFSYNLITRSDNAYFLKPAFFTIAMILRITTVITDLDNWNIVFNLKHLPEKFHITIMERTCHLSGDRLKFILFNE
jgi:hypothetical protein